MRKKFDNFSKKVTRWIGSSSSLIVHSCIFLFFFFLTLSNVLPRDLILLIWNTLVSLEAIYLAIFIQMTVNQHSEELEEVSEDIGEIQEDVGEIQKDVEDIQEEIQDDEGSVPQ
jgi:peptidoglycan hydrolase CwlO-like protein